VHFNSEIVFDSVVMASVGEIDVPCGEMLDATMAFFVDELGFRVILIYPADAPSVAVVIGHGLRLRLSSDPPTTTLRIRLLNDNFMFVFLIN